MQDFSRDWLLDSTTTGRAEGIEQIPDTVGHREKLEYFRLKSTEIQLETHKTQAELVSTRKELGWVKTKPSSTQSGGESAAGRLARGGGGVEWLGERLTGTRAELEGSKNEAGGLRRLNSARSGSATVPY